MLQSISRHLRQTVMVTKIIAVALFDAVGTLSMTTASPSFTSRATPAIPKSRSRRVTLRLATFAAWAFLSSPAEPQEPLESRLPAIASENLRARPVEEVADELVRAAKSVDTAAEIPTGNLPADETATPGGSPTTTLATSIIALCNERVDVRGNASEREKILAREVDTICGTLGMAPSQAPNADAVRRHVATVTTARASRAGATGATLSTQGAILTGLTDFLLHRARREVTDYLLDHVFARVCDKSIRLNCPKKSASVTDLFPLTCAVRDRGSARVTVRELGNVLEAAIENDLREMPTIFLSCAQHSSEREEVAFARLVLSLLHGLQRGDHPLIASGNAALDSTVSCKTPNGSTVCAARLFGLSLIAIAGRYRELEYLQIADAGATAQLVDLLALDVAVLGQGRALTDPELTHLQADIDDLRSLLRLGVVSAKEIWANLKALSETEDRPSVQERRGLAFDIVRVVHTLWAEGLSLAGDTLLFQGSRRADLDKLVAVVDGVFDAFEAALAGRYDRMLASVYRLSDLLSLEFPPERLRRHLPIVTALASAETAEKAEAVLETYAAPLATWRAKQRGATVSLTGLVGAQIGTQQETNGRLAAFVPIGIDWTRGRRAQGFFFSIIDLGNLAEIRLDDEANGEAVTVANPRLKDVVSPGVYFRQALSESPFVWGIGAAYRGVEVTREGGDSAHRSRWQVGFFVGVDVTILTFWHHDKL